MRGTGIYHPKFAAHPALGLVTSMTDTLEIYKPTGAQPTWNPLDGIENNGFELIYRGPGRAQPQIDWRARDRNFANELTATEGVRVQIPFGRNELTDDGSVGEIFKDYKVVITASNSSVNAPMIGQTLIVSNALQAGQHWLRSMMCTTGTRSNG